ncbi:hypothetical protein PR048_007818 [Dryococelus australis]|uniref:Uncharacterized protein n=1 Tax=Dryococelus australis TaxID=614101 RepID=A0ABQ9HVB9_9NEOP|nr:hypothetical protein PR048_007818 [Dryococelus australis]
MLLVGFRSVLPLSLPMHSVILPGLSHPNTLILRLADSDNLDPSVGQRAPLGTIRLPSSHQLTLPEYPICHKAHSRTSRDHLESGYPHTKGTVMPFRLSILTYSVTKERGLASATSTYLELANACIWDSISLVAFASAELMAEFSDADICVLLAYILKDSRDLKLQPDQMKECQGTLMKKREMKRISDHSMLLCHA